MVTLHILPKTTQSGGLYALIENVVCRPDMRGKSYGTMAMQAAVDAAWAANAKKFMLITKQGTSALEVYESLGVTSDQTQGLQLRRIPPRSP